MRFTINITRKFSDNVSRETIIGNYTTCQRKGEDLIILIRVPTTCTELLYEGFDLDIKCTEITEEITRKCDLYKRSLFKGYITRKTNNEGSYVIKIYRYIGRYGKGYAIFTPNWNSNNYLYVEYWIERDGE